MNVVSPQFVPRHVSGLDLSPEQVFAQVSGKPGAVFLDSGTAGEAFSILAFEPDEMLRGKLADSAELGAWLESNALPQAPDVGFPLGGAFGQIDYDGEFCFGLYRRCLVFEHQTGNWIDVGGLSDAIDRSGGDRDHVSGFTLNFEPNLPRSAFCAAVRAAKDYIEAGDIYQVNLAQRFIAVWEDFADPYEFYLALRHASPAPFAAFQHLGDRQILSSSPEQFLRLSGRGIRTRPIKGTRPRYRDREKDERSRYDLITSEKERSELIMITDLERNDLGQVCEFGSVETSKLLELETYEHVFHLVSTVEGVLRSDVSHLEALSACFPGGSITGAPKKRAREIISELEPGERGVFTGAIGYFGLNGESQFNIAIRTAVIEGTEAHFHVGAGIVADSSPELEFEETLHKAAGILQAAEAFGKRRLPVKVGR